MARKHYLLKVLEKSTISGDGYNSTNKPFFSCDNNSQKFVINFHSLNHYNIPYGLNNNVKLIYKILGNPKKEIYIGEWTIITLDKALELYNNYCKKGQPNVFDIAYKYDGLGWITIVSCDLKSHTLFYRQDGGSNGYDRQDNLDKLIKNGANDYKKIYFSDWFYKININNNENNIEFKITL